MSKTFPRKTYPPEKSVFTTQTIPNTIIDNIRMLANAGEYGKLEEYLINYPIKLNFSENKLNTSLLHGVIRSSITNTQKLRLVELLIKYGIPINLQDDQGFTPLYYAIQLQLVDIVKILIDKTNSLNNLPKNYDYFRLALSPSIINCKPQLINQATSSMGKYYSQQIDYEREFRILMNKEDITKNIVRYILEFSKRLPQQELKYIDEGEIKSTTSVKLLGTEYSEIFPPFENKIKLFLDTISDKIYALLSTGKINKDQLITTKIELIKSLNSELSTFLNRASIRETLSLNSYEYDANDNVDIIYNKLIKKEINYNELIVVLINKYSNEVEDIKNTINEFIGYVDSILNELIALESDANIIRNLYNNIGLLFTEIQNVINVNIDPNNINIINSINAIVLIIKSCNRLIHITNSNIGDADLDNVNARRPKNLGNLKTKINELQAYLGQKSDELNKNIKKINLFIVELNNISEQYLLYNKFNPDNQANKFLFNDTFLMYKPINFDDLSLYSDKELFYHDDPIDVLNYKLVNNVNIEDKRIVQNNDNNNEKWRDSLYTLTYIPSIMKITNMNFLLLIFHEKIFKQIFQLPEYNQIKDKFKNENPAISDKIISTLLLKILHSSILNNFEEILSITLLTVANTLVNNKLDETIDLDKYKDIDNDKILKILIGKEKNKFNELTRVDKEQNFYLDENYTSSEPIDVVSCLNNNVEILKMLKKKMGFKIKEYQELIFKLGNKDILDKLNETTTTNKITKIDLESYRERNKNKFITACDFFNNQLKDEIKQKELDFFNVNVDDELMIYNIERPVQLNINQLPALSFEDIYNDLIDTQVKSNIFLYQKIRIKLESVFKDIIIREVTKFLQFFSDGELGTVITYDNLKENLRPLIGDIINYHLNIDPAKAKTEVIPLDNTLSKFKDLFINLLNQNDKQIIPGIYDERLKSKIFDFMTLISKYYNNIYRNYLKYVFNDYRYSLLGENLV